MKDKSRKVNCRYTEMNNANKRIVLIGKTGCGKSSTGNAILGKESFHTSLSPIGITKRCNVDNAERFGEKIIVVDTPGISATSTRNSDTVREMAKSLSMAHPGPHIIIFILAIGRFTKEDIKTVESYKQLFGDNIMDFTMLVFTRRDDLEKEGISFDQFTKEAQPFLKEMLEKCKHISLDATSADDDHVKELLENINQIVMKNNGQYYTSEMFEIASQKLRNGWNDIQETEEQNELDRRMLEIQRCLQDEINKLTQRYLSATTENIKLRRERGVVIEGLKETVRENSKGKRTRSKSIPTERKLTEINISQLPEDTEKDGIRTAVECCYKKRTKKRRGEL